MENKKTEVCLIGRWQLIRQFNVDGAGGRNLRILGPEEHIVEFLDDGTLTEIAADLIATTTFHYEPATRTISIQPANLNSESPLANGTPFRIIPLDNSEIYFVSECSLGGNDESCDFEIILLERI